MCTLKVNPLLHDMMTIFGDDDRLTGFRRLTKVYPEFKEAAAEVEKLQDEERISYMCSSCSRHTCAYARAWTHPLVYTSMYIDPARTSMYFCVHTGSVG